jgi:hypothetical protein
MRKRLLLIILILLGIQCISARAVTIDPGTYKLKWQPIKGQAECVSTQDFSVGRKPASITEKVNGLKSERTFWGTSASFKIIIDESKGSNTGYDVAYLIPIRYAADITDLSNAIVLPLKKKTEDELVSVKTVQPVEVVLGKRGKESVYRAQVSVSVTMETSTNVLLFKGGEDQTVLIPCYAHVTIYSGWCGKIKSDHGELNIVTIDTDGDGLFGARYSKDRNGQVVTTGDGIWIGKHKPGCECKQCQWVTLGKASSYCDRLYSIDVSRTGDTVKIRPYAGVTGTLVFRAVDGRNLPAKCSTRYISGTSGFFDINIGKAVRLPVGNYTYGLMEIPPLPEVGETKQFTVVSFGRDDRINIKEGRRTVARVGGPIKMQIEPSISKITVKLGESKDISLDFSVGSGKSRFLFLGEQPPKVNIRDSKGKIVASGIGKFG